jgi:hypothetical protein
VVFESQREALSDDAISNLGRRDQLGADLNFDETVPKFRLARQILEGVDAKSEWASGQTIQNLTDAAAQLSEARDQVAAFTSAQPDPSSVRAAIISRVDRALDNMKQWGAPIALASTYGDTSALVSLVEGNAQRASVEATRIAELGKSLDDLVANARGKGATLSAHQTSAYYGNQAEGHRLKSYIGAVAAGACTLLLLLVAAGLPDWLGKVDDADLTSPNPILAVAVAVGPRVFVAGLLAYALRFTLRYFSVNNHLQVVNESKRNALDTVPLLLASASDPATGDALLAEIVRALFLDPNTGFVPEGTASLSLPGGLSLTTKD